MNTSHALDMWNHALKMTGSHQKGGVLLDAYASWLAMEDDEYLTDDDMRQLIFDWWTSCEAWGDDLDEALSMLADLAPVGEPLPPTDPYDHLTVYRATGGERPDGGSWTLDPAVAEQFAEQIRSGRGAFLGMHSTTPVVWTGSVDPADVLGYFTDRNEAEVVLPPGVVSNVEAAVTFGAHVGHEREAADPANPHE